MGDPQPISVNKLYASNGSRRFLTKKGKHYKDCLTREVAQATLPLPWKVIVDAVYKQGAWVRLEIELYLSRVHNGSWRVGGNMIKGKNPRPRSPYQRVDATNYVKLIEDAVAAGTGIDDSAHLEVEVRKLEDKKKPRVVVTYQVYE
jgi:Holliday junction resolvase RusA-like endonuclease